MSSEAGAAAGLDSSCSFQWLYRLYDVDEATAALRCTGGGTSFRRLYPSDLPAADRFARLWGEASAPAWTEMCAARLPVTAVGAFAEGEMVGIGLYDIGFRGAAGPLLLAPGSPGRLGAALLAETLLAMLHHGYLYAVDFDVPAGAADAVGSAAGVRRPEQPAALAPRQRDLDLPFADLFEWLDGESSARGTGSPDEAATVRRPVSSERDLVVGWIRREFGRGWASEMEATFSHHPITSVIAVDRDDGATPEERLLGFCCYDSAGLGVSSTIGVRPSAAGGRRGPAMARQILEGCTREMYRSGYRFFIGAGVSRRLGFLKIREEAWTIPGSCPGFYRDVIAYK